MTHSNTKQSTTDWNGWTNYETWLAHCCLSNHEGSYHTIRQLAQSHSDLDKAAAAIRAYLQEHNPFEEGEILVNMMLYARIHQALQSINWREIAAAFREE